MKIGILGSRGIPNAYGGFEQFAESLALYLVGKKHEVYVYNSSLHPNSEKVWNGVNIITCYDPENKIGTAGQFIYDLNCIIDSRKRNFDILLQLGYTSSAIWHWLLPKKSLVLTNMDGLEWMRSKYSKKVQKFLKYSERLAANNSDYLIADSLGIQDYLKKELKKDSEYIAYGADEFANPKESSLEKYNVEKGKYFILIARMEPENNIWTILKGFDKSELEIPFLVIGNTSNAYGQKLLAEFKNENIRFLGSIYNQEDLNNLRYYSRMYFHGHSVGGTNPSLVEAMASSSLIAAHNNPFNRGVLGEHAYYFDNEEDVADLMKNLGGLNSEFIQGNLEKIRGIYSKQSINENYEALFKRLHS